MQIYETCAGDEISPTINNAISQAISYDELITFEFNDVEVIVGGNSNPELILRDWERGMSGYLGDDPVVGPYPDEELSASDLESDSKIKALQDEESKKTQAGYDKKQSEQKLALQNALHLTGPIELSDKPLWDSLVESNDDDYGLRVVCYAEDWARLMQGRIHLGSTVADCAKDTGELADDDGISGAMHGFAMQTLVQCWKHGDELRAWKSGAK